MEYLLRSNRTRHTGTGSEAPSTRIIILAIFILWTLWRVVHHELWRDEAGLWLHLVHTDTLVLLRHNLDYGGHPLLWPLLLYPLARLSSDPFLMQCLHVACAALSVFLVLRFAPFTLFEKILLVFGYYLSFEYAVITRHYALSVLMLLGYLTLRSPGKSSSIPAALFLALLAETNVYGTILAAALLAGWMMGGRKSQDGGIDASPGPGKGGTILVLLGIIVAFVDMKPPSDYVFARAWHFSLNGELLVQSLARAWRGLFPVPELHDHFWNSNILADHPPAAASAAVFLLLVCLWSFRRQRGVLLSVSVAVAGLLAFTYLKYMGYQRHNGFFFLAVFSGYWLYRQEPPYFSRQDKVFRLIVWKPMLFIQLVVALYASYMDYRLPFSGSRAAAEYLVNHDLQDLPIAVYPLERVKPVSLYIDQGLYNLGSGRVEKFAVFNKTSWVRLSQQEVVNRARKRLAETAGRAVFILSEFTLPEDEFRLLALVPETAIVKNERYAIYIARADRPVKGSATEKR